MKTCCLLFVPLLFWSWVTAQAFTEIQVTGVSNPVLSLNGTWKICLSPPPEFWRENQSGGDWHDIQVPGEAMMQGFPIRHDQPFVFLKTFEILTDYQGKILKLRFEGIFKEFISGMKSLRAFIRFCLSGWPFSQNEFFMNDLKLNQVEIHWNSFITFPFAADVRRPAGPGCIRIACPGSARLF